MLELRVTPFVLKKIGLTCVDVMLVIGNLAAYM